MTLLSNTEILRHKDLTGAIVIEPFDPTALNNVSYDLTLGDTIARYRRPRDEALDLAADEPSEMFKHQRATSGLGGRGFHLEPGERVLGHSREIAGGRQVVCGSCKGEFESGLASCTACNSNGTVAVTTQLHATSTAARVGISVCQCAGFGDVGFLDRWTLEIQNHSPHALWLPVGAVICQVSFYEVAPVLAGTSYDVTGRYAQAVHDPAATHAAWTPERMLPKKVKVRP